MHSSTKSTSYAGMMAALISLALIGGCAQMKDWVEDFRSDIAKNDNSNAREAPSARLYLAELSEFTTASPETQREIITNTEADLAQHDSIAAALRLALIFATPGHDASDPDRARKLLSDLLADTTRLTSPELSLSRINLYAVEQLLARREKEQELQAEYMNTVRNQQAAAERRIQSKEAENRKLREDLAQAEAKLEAITSIERSIRAQE